MADVAVGVPDLLRALDVAGVFGNAMLGGAVARAHRFDPVGFAVLAIASGLGGGMIRDVLLQHGPPVALTDPLYLWCALGGALVAFVVKFEGAVWEAVFPWVDALALGAWAAAGAQKTLLLGLSWLPAILLGTVTAVGGGVVRDISTARVPAIFGRNPLYASAAALASAVMALLQSRGWWETGPLIATAVGAAACLLARWRGWMLPVEFEWREAARRTVPPAVRRTLRGRRRR